jgi:hypothetical protein
MRINLIQQVPTTATASNSVLQQGDTLSFAATANPQNPSVRLDFIFNVGARSYFYNYTVPTFYPIGSTAPSVPINMGVILGFFGIPCQPCYAVQLNIGLNVTSFLQGYVSESGFAGTSVLTWYSAGTQTTTLPFLASTDVAAVGINPLQFVQSWSLYASFSVSILKLSLFQLTFGKVVFSSNPVDFFTWYHLTTTSQYSTMSGAGWYLSGTQATISVADSLVSTAPGVREVFTDWQAFGNGGYTGAQQTQQIVVNSPITETAGWKTQFQVTFDQGAMLALNAITPSSTGGQGRWYDAGSPVSIVLNGVWGRNAGVGSRLQSYTINGGPVIPALTTGPVAILQGPILRPDAVSVSVITQYQIILDPTVSPAVGSVTSPTIVADNYWYDSGTSVSVILNTVIPQSTGIREVLKTYSVNGATSAPASNLQGLAVVNTLGISQTYSVASTTGTQYLVTIEPASGGIVLPSPGTEWVDAGFQLTLQAAPDGSHQFGGWTINGQLASTSSELVERIDSPIDIATSFTLIHSQSSPTITSSQSTLPNAAQTPQQATASGSNSAVSLSDPIILIGIGVLVLLAVMAIGISRRK